MPEESPKRRIVRTAKIALLAGVVALVVVAAAFASTLGESRKSASDTLVIANASRPCR